MAKVECTCLNCGKLFHVIPAEIKNGHGKYCSYTCKSEAQIKGSIHKCLSCGKEFFASMSETRRNGGKYCSRECYFKSKTKGKFAICKICGISFWLMPSGEKAGRKCCSKECAAISRYNKITCNCNHCGKEFVKHLSSQRKYCSSECRYAGQSAATSGENNYYWKGGSKHSRGKNWPSQRKLARLRDGDTCQLCKRIRKQGQKMFHIHHIKPFIEFNGDYISANDLSNLITLCPSCHNKAEHGLVPTPKYLL